MFTNTPPPLHAPQAAAQLNEGARTFVTASAINAAQSPPKLYNTWQWLPMLYTKILIQNGCSYLSYSCRRAPRNSVSQIEGSREAKKWERDCNNAGSYLINPS